MERENELVEESEELKKEEEREDMVARFAKKVCKKLRHQNATCDDECELY